MVLTAEDLVARLCAMVPPPRFHLTRYAGVLASNAALRAEVVPGRAKEIERNGVTNDDAQRELFGASHRTSSHTSFSLFQGNVKGSL